LKLREIQEILEAKVIVGEEYLDREVLYAFSSDLMSDVLAYVNEDTILLTGLNNPQVIRTAEMMDLPAIVFVRGKLPGSDLIELAKNNKLTVLFTTDTMYTASGKLYKNGLEGLKIKEGSIEK